MTDSHCILWLSVINMTDSTRYTTLIQKLMIFLAYHNQDLRIVIQIYSELLKSVKDEFWFAPEKIEFGQNWREQVKYGIESSDCLILFSNFNELEGRRSFNFTEEERMIRMSLIRRPEKRVALLNFKKRNIPYDRLRISKHFDFSNDIDDNQILNLQNSSGFESLVTYLNLPNRRLN
ncbi:TIR domain-containing protein [Algoriphagus sediminis]|uniref:TIR domain-containing protein n=1 Tax=Algoriphagus sediminis TaxID=3057113 RepID=A0ABT7YGE5_9BACT|nr:TIR domain-containing protein [Algoriphagus sediminis]MDN3205594.1 TIR domain-containing protein [Algoriphagus sediminis]